MLPVLFSIGPITLYTFGIFIGIAFFAGLYVVWKRGNELHYEEKDLFDTVFVALLWAFVGARIGYVLIHLSDFLPMMLQALNVFGKPGWFLPAGLLAGAVSVSQEARKRKWDMYQLFDIFTTGLVLFQAILAGGSFIAGVGYGMSTTSWIGVHFAGLYDKRYPIQLWEMIGLGVCFSYLWWVESVYRTFGWYRRHRSQAATGFLTAIYLIWWGSVTGIAQLFRLSDMTLLRIRFDVVIPLLVSVCGGWLLLYRSGVTLKDVVGGFATYFGLRKKDNKTKREEMIREMLQ